MCSLASSEGKPETERVAANRQSAIHKYRFLQAGTAFTLFLLLAVGIQWKAGSYRSELSHWPDAPSHVINSLLLRDYFAHHVGENPLRVAEKYYVHYPKVSIGMWPPVYYAIAGIWTLIFGFSNPSLLVLAALSASVLASVVGWIVSRDFGFAWGIAGGLLALALPQIVFGFTIFLLDVPVAAMQLFAIIALVRYLDSRRFSDAVWFGIIATLAMLTKGNAIALAFAAPLLILVTRSWWVFRKPGLYASTAMVALIAFPWHLYSLHIISSTDLVDPANFTFIISRWHKLIGYCLVIRYNVGTPLLIPALIGLWLSFRRGLTFGSGKTRSGAGLLRTGVGSLAVASLAFHVLAPIPGPDERYMTTVYACLVILFFYGVWWLAAGLGSVLAWPVGARATLLASGAVLASAGTLFALPALPPTGFSEVSNLVQKEGRPYDTFFILSNPEGEGAFVVETAMRDSSRPQRFVIRASKILSDNAWSPHQYRPLFEAKEDVLKMLYDLRIHFAVIDLSFTQWKADREALLAAIRSDPQRWTPIYDATAPGADRRLLVFRQNLPDYTPVFPMRVNVRHALGRDLILEH
jgi:dolichyl-phosphate-mannose-protein mannosyltransferase